MSTNFFAEQDRCRNVAAARAKADRDERLTQHERASLADDHVRRVMDEIIAKLRADKTRDAFLIVLAEMAGGWVGQGVRHDNLEDRIAALEAAAGQLGAGKVRLVARNPREAA
jgi:hypothetical protein